MDVPRRRRWRASGKVTPFATRREGSWRNARSRPPRKEKPRRSGAFLTRIGLIVESGRLGSLLATTLAQRDADQADAQQAQSTRLRHAVGDVGQALGGQGRADQVEVADDGADRDRQRAQRIQLQQAQDREAAVLFAAQAEAARRRRRAMPGRSTNASSKLSLRCVVVGQVDGQAEVGDQIVQRTEAGVGSGRGYR